MLVVFVGTAIHQSYVNTFPLGIFLAFAILLSAAIQLRPTRAGSWFFTIFVSSGLFVSALSSNQDAVLPANELGFIWSYGAIGLAAVVSLWPRLKTKS